MKSLCPVCWRNAAGWLWQELVCQFSNICRVCVYMVYSFQTQGEPISDLKTLESLFYGFPKRTSKFFGVWDSLKCILWARVTEGMQGCADITLGSVGVGVFLLCVRRA